MSTFEAPLFTLAEDISLNEEQQAAQLAFHEVATLNLFDNSLFCNIHMNLQRIIFWLGAPKF